VPARECTKIFESMRNQRFRARNPFRCHSHFVSQLNVLMHFRGRGLTVRAYPLRCRDVTLRLEAGQGLVLAVKGRDKI
jgi:hypothetical protein